MLRSEKGKEIGIYSRKYVYIRLYNCIAKIFKLMWNKKKSNNIYLILLNFRNFNPGGGCLQALIQGYQIQDNRPCMALKLVEPGTIMFTYVSIICLFCHINFCKNIFLINFDYPHESHIYYLLINNLKHYICKVKNYPSQILFSQNFGNRLVSNILPLINQSTLSKWKKQKYKPMSKPQLKSELKTLKLASKVEHVNSKHGSNAWFSED